MNLVTVISTELKAAKTRLIKVLRYGKRDVQTPREIAPYGVDSSPIKDMVALYAPTSDISAPVIVGYINKNQKAGVGEFRTFATDANGTEKFYTWMKADGTMEIGGNIDYAVRYLKLDMALQAEVIKINTELGKIATAIAALGGAYTVAPVTIDISAAQIKEIRTP